MQTVRLRRQALLSGDRRLLASALVLLIGWHAHADSAPQTQPTPTDPDPALTNLDADEWQFTLTPYAFIPLQMTGDTTIDGVTMDMDLNISDIFSNFRVIPFATYFTAQKGDSDWGLFSNFYFIELDSKGFTLNPPIPGAPTGDIDVLIRQVIVDWGVTYKLAKLPVGTAANGHQPMLTVAAYGGARYEAFTQKVEVSLGPATGKPGGTEDWIAPTIGMRFELDLNEQWNVEVAGLVSGFGIGTAPDVEWNALVGFGYNPNDWLEIRIDYYLYGIDYLRTTDDGPFGADLFMHGPWLGASITF